MHWTGWQAEPGVLALDAHVNDGLLSWNGFWSASPMEFGGRNRSDACSISGGGAFRDFEAQHVEN